MSFDSSDGRFWVLAAVSTVGVLGRLASGSRGVVRGPRTSPWLTTPDMFPRVGQYIHIASAEGRAEIPEAKVVEVKKRSVQVSVMKKPPWDFELVKIDVPFGWMDVPRQWRTEVIPWIEPGSRYKTAGIQYGFDPRTQKWNPAPYFSMTYERKGSGGAPETGTWLRHLPRGPLRKLPRWHSVDANGVKMHYVANGVFWADLVAGRRRPGSHEPPDPLSVFKSAVVFGAVPHIDHGEPWLLPRPELEAWLKDRIPFLNEAFKADMAAAGVLIPPRSEWKDPNA